MYAPFKMPKSLELQFQRAYAATETRKAGIFKADKLSQNYGSFYKYNKEKHTHWNNQPP